MAGIDWCCHSGARVRAAAAAIGQRGLLAIEESNPAGQITWAIFSTPAWLSAKIF